MLTDLLHGTRTRIVRLRHEVLQRVVGTGGLYSVGYGDVGSSIYYALGVTTLWALGAAPLVIAIAGVFFVFTVLTYCELATALPEAGGISTYARRAFNDAMGFITGWALLLDYVVTIAISAYVIGPYLGYFFPLLKRPDMNLFFTIGIILLLTGINIIGIRESTGFSLVLALISLTTQVVLLIVGGLMLFNLPRLLGQIDLGTAPTWSHFIYGITISMVAYTGIGAISQMAGEARDPGKVLPRALLLTMVTVLIMTIGISSIALSAMTPQELSTTWLEDPVAGIAYHMPVIGPYLSPWIALLGASILLIATNAGVIGASRLAYSMGSLYLLPAGLTRLQPRFKTPYLTLAIFPSIAAVIVLVAQDLTHMADLYNFGAMLSYTLAHLSLIGLRIKEPQLHRPFKLKGNIRIHGKEIPITAVLGLLSTFAVWVVVVITHPYGRTLGFLWMGIGVILYSAYRMKAHMPVVEPLAIETIEMPFVKIQTQTILVPILPRMTGDMLQAACKMAKEDGSQITALYVVEVPMTLPLSASLVKETEEGRKALDYAQAVAQEYGVPIEVRQVQARSAGRVIVETAREIGAELIMLGTGEKHRFGDLVFGKTVDYVLKNSPCRVWASH